ncbi:MAG: hypothetical protein ACE5JL_15290 [Dehalococcoidia bacterium]
MDERFYKHMFLAGAFWNVVGGGIVIALDGWIFSTADLDPPHPGLYYQSWVALFVTFGIGYYFVYRDMFSNKNIVVLGIIGKLAFSAIFIYNFAASSDLVPLLFIIPVVGDLLFVVLFGSFLNFARKTQR